MKRVNTIMKKISISVREIIEYVLRTGDINTIYLGSSRLKEGIKLHQNFQNNEGESYEKEVSISIEAIADDIIIALNGRIDGVITVDDKITIDEIKTTGRDLEGIEGNNKLHWAQVKVYAYMYCVKNNLKIINTRLTYIGENSLEAKQYEQIYSINELKDFFDNIIEKYTNWASKQEQWKEICINSINNIDFPFSDYRDGQRQLMAATYKTIIDKNILFARAPTGIGKTIATIFPSIKALGQEKCEKIFYLTAKTIGKEVVANTLNMLEANGLKIKRINITAKEKICLNDKKSCNPEDCIYAKGHYDRVNKVIEELFCKYDYFNRDIITKYSLDNKVCPHELSLDLALYSNVIICDYNYVFDPSAVLKRFFIDNSGKYVLLIDEAHNLVDRARDMYSATIEKNKVLKLKKQVKEIDATLYKYFTKLNKELINIRKDCDQYKEKRFEENNKPVECEKILRGILHRTEKIFSTNIKLENKEELLDFYFESYDFLKKCELYNERYITYYEKIGQDIIVKLYCIDPSLNIREAIINMQGVIYFSATLHPMNYFVRILGGDEKSYGLIMSSPFEQNNMKLLIEKNISTKYKNRENSVKPIIDTIKKVVDAKKGNYIVFFPSYKYMYDVYEEYICEEQINSDIIVQNKGLTEKEKEEFINEFHEKRKNTLVAFAVLGGMFSEGIDLTGEKLSGAIIVGIGLPQICYERNLIKNYFDNNENNGFEYAYVFPGMNKVMQASGRVIRTINDKGVVILIDERFNQRYYSRLFPEEWSHAYAVKTTDNINEIIKKFWSE